MDVLNKLKQIREMKAKVVPTKNERELLDLENVRKELEEIRKIKEKEYSYATAPEKISSYVDPRKELHMFPAKRITIAQNNENMFKRYMMNWDTLTRAVGFGTLSLILFFTSNPLLQFIALFSVMGSGFYWIHHINLKRAFASTDVNFAVVQAIRVHKPW